MGEERVRVAWIEEFNQQQILQQSWFNDFAARIQTLEALSPCEHQLLTQHIQHFQLLEDKVQEMQSNKKDHCAHHQQLLEDGVLKQIQKQTNELSLLQLRLDQLDKKFNSANNITKNAEDMKEIVIQVEIVPTECQGGLQELRAHVDAVSFQHPEQFKVNAKLVNNEGLGNLQEFRTHAKPVSETLNAKILECQELKTNTKLIGDTAFQESPRFRQVARPIFRSVKCTRAGSPIRFQQNASCVCSNPVQYSCVGTTKVVHAH